jgi:hypothetical protein
MMSDCLTNFFAHFGAVPTDSIVMDIAQRWEKDTKPGQGIFFDFSATPELQKPLLDYLVNRFGWSLEKKYFIRKPLKRILHLGVLNN